MQKVKIVEKVLGDRFAKHGFEFLGSVDRGMWEFKKISDNDIEQFIAIYMDRYDSGCVYLDIRSKYGQLRTLDFAPEPKYENKQVWIFRDDAEFAKALEEMGDIIEKYGYKKLDELGVPPYKFEPTHEMFVRLYENHKELSAKFMKDNNLKDDITLKDSIDIIARIVEERGERVLDDTSKEKLLELAAFYGEQLIKEYKGNWEWIKINNSCKVNGMTNLSRSAYVLHEVFFTWEKESSERIMGYYKRMVENDKVGYYHKNKWIPR